MPVDYIALGTGTWIFNMSILIALAVGLGFSMYGLGLHYSDKEKPEFDVALVFSVVLALAFGITSAILFGRLEITKNCLNACLRNFGK
jgi:choline-glycine betaine transporter